jgi:hypothetical protein
LSLVFNSFSHNVIQRIISNFPNVYLEISIRETQTSNDKSIEQILNIFSNGEDTPQFQNIQNQNNLSLWLNRISYIKDYNSSTQTQTVLVSSVLKYVAMANSNAAFRESFELVISDAAETCGDRMALSIIRLDLLSQLGNDDSDSAHREHILINGVLTLSILELAARQKVASMKKGCIDEIEVYLAYPTKLKKKLDIPINISEMLYYDISGVTQQDLDIAEEMVLAARANKELREEVLRQYSGGDGVGGQSQ